MDTALWAVVAAFVAALKADPLTLIFRDNIDDAFPGTIQDDHIFIISDFDVDQVTDLTDSEPTEESFNFKVVVFVTEGGEYQDVLKKLTDVLPAIKNAGKSAGVLAEVDTTFPTHLQVRHGRADDTHQQLSAEITIQCARSLA